MNAFQDIATLYKRSVPKVRHVKRRAQGFRTIIGTTLRLVDLPSKLRKQSPVSGFEAALFEGLASASRRHTYPLCDHRRHSH